MNAVERYLAITMDERRRVNLLLTSDIHTSGIGDIDTAGASVIIIAGDIMGGGMDSDTAGYEYLEKEFFPWCGKNADKDIIITAGNHDKFLYRLYKREEKVAWPKNVRYLCDKMTTLRGMKIYGTPWCENDRSGRFECSNAELFEKFSRVPQNLDILIAHTPPYIPGCAIDMNDNGVHEGSKALTETIIEKKPRLVICGHVHSGSREPLKFHGATVMNVARVNQDRSSEAFKPRIVRYNYEI